MLEIGKAQQVGGELPIGKALAPLFLSLGFCSLGAFLAFPMRSRTGFVRKYLLCWVGFFPQIIPPLVELLARLVRIKIDTARNVRHKVLGDLHHRPVTRERTRSLPTVGGAKAPVGEDSGEQRFARMAMRVKSEGYALELSQAPLGHALGSPKPLAAVAARDGLASVASAGEAAVATAAVEDHRSTMPAEPSVPHTREPGSRKAPRAQFGGGRKEGATSIEETDTPASTQREEGSRDGTPEMSRLSHAAKALVHKATTYVHHHLSHQGPNHYHHRRLQTLSHLYAKKHGDGHGARRLSVLDQHRITIARERSARLSRALKDGTTRLTNRSSRFSHEGASSRQSLGHEMILGLSSGLHSLEHGLHSLEHVTSRRARAEPTSRSHPRRGPRDRWLLVCCSSAARLLLVCSQGLEHSLADLAAHVHLGEHGELHEAHDHHEVIFDRPPRAGSPHAHVYATRTPRGPS